MRKTFIILSIVFAVLSVVFTALPLNSLAFAPIGLALLFIVLAYIKSNTEQRKLPKQLFVITYLCAVVVLIKIFFFKDEVAVDTQFEQKKIETKQEAKKDLEDLEKDLE